MPVDDAILDDLITLINVESGIVSERKQVLRRMQEAIAEIKMQPRDNIIPEVPAVPAVLDPNDSSIIVTPEILAVPERIEQIFDKTPKDKSTGKDVTTTRRQAVYDNLLLLKTELGL